MITQFGKDKMNKSDDAFEKELLKIKDSLDRYAYMLTKNRDDANDLLQDTMFKALVNRDKYISDTNFKGWAFTIMKNIFRNKCHRDSHIYSLLDPYDEHLNTHYVTHNENYTIKEIHLAIASFPNEYITPFLMHHAGFKYEEIAKHMHIPLGTVKSRIYYARKKLQVLLKDYREDY